MGNPLGLSVAERKSLGFPEKIQLMLTPMTTDISAVRVALCMLLVIGIIVFIWTLNVFVIEPLKITIANTKAAFSSTTFTGDADLAALEAESLALDAQMTASVNANFSAAQTNQDTQMADGLADLQAADQVQNVVFIPAGETEPVVCPILTSVKTDIDNMITEFVDSSNQSIADVVTGTQLIRDAVVFAPLSISCSLYETLLTCGGGPNSFGRIEICDVQLYFTFPGDVSPTRINYCEDCVDLLGFEGDVGNGYPQCPNAAYNCP